jgi:hypothetical protein
MRGAGAWQVCIPTYTLAVSISSEINRHAIVQGKSATKMSRQAEQMDQYNAVRVCACALRACSLLCVGGVSSDAAACRGLQVFARVEQALDVMKAFNPSHVRKIDMVLDKYHRHYLVGTQRASAGQEAFFSSLPQASGGTHQLPFVFELTCDSGLCGSDTGMHDFEEGAAGAHSHAAYQLGQRWHGGALMLFVPTSSLQVGVV